jgi:hypothetical protein
VAAVLNILGLVVGESQPSKGGALILLIAVVAIATIINEASIKQASGVTANDQKETADKLHRRNGRRR